MKSMLSYILSIIAISVISIAICLVMYAVYTYIIQGDVETPSAPCKILFAEHNDKKLVIRVYEVDNGRYKAVVTVK